MGRDNCLRASSEGRSFCYRPSTHANGRYLCGASRKSPIKIIDDDPFIADSLSKGGYEILESALDSAVGAMLLAKGTSDDYSILVDQMIGPKDLGTDLIAGQGGRRNVFLCTNDFGDLDVVRRAREIGVKIIPKPFCFFIIANPN